VTATALRARLRANPHDRPLLRLAVPALGALVAEPLYVLTDTAIVGHLGTDQLAGLSLATAVILTGYAIFLFLAYGTTAAVSRLLGAGDHAEAARQAVQGLWLAVIVGGVLAAAGLVAGDRLIAALGGDGAVATNAEVYLRISLFGFPALLVSLAAVGYLRGRQDTRSPLLVALGTAVGNGVLESVLIFGFDRGIGASALSTALAQTVAAAVYVRIVVGAARRFGAHLRPDGRSIARLAVVGFHIAARTAALRGSLLLGVAVAARIGTDDLAAYEVGFQIWSLAALALDAVAIAAQALVGHALGAGDAAGARAIGQRAIEWGLAAGAAVAVVLLASRPWVGGLFTSDPAVARLIGFSVLLVAAMQPLCGVVFSLDGILIGAGDLRYLSVAMLAAFATFAASAALVTAAGAGLGWLWAAFTAFMIARCVVLVARFATPRWIVLGAVR
jgi:putative MATE family efflux protein